MKINTKAIFLAVILFIGLFLRLYQLDKIPASLFGDEIDVGYQAWSLGTTGKDYMGNTLPTFLQSFSEWRTPLLSYLLSPILTIFGPSTLSVRIPVAIFGVLNILLIYLLFRKLFPKYVNAALISAFILCISPWHIHFSRIAFDSTLLINLYLFASILILSNKFALSLPILILTLYTYPTANIFTPIFILSSYLIFKPKINLSKNIFLYLLTVVLLTPITFSIISGSASGRFSRISIFSDPKITDSIITTRTESWVIGSPLEPIFHNKLVAYTSAFFNQYISAFSTNFLFTNGDPNFRHSIGEYGEFFLFLAPFLAIGFYSLLSRLKDSSAKFVFAWLVLSPIPSALTQEGGSHAIRLIIMLPPLVIIFSLAIYDTISSIKKIISPKILYLFFVIVSLVSLTFYWHRYSSHYRFLSYRNWQYGYESVMSNIPILSNSTNLFINNTYEPSLLKYLFYARVLPKDFQNVFTGDRTVDKIYKDVSGYKLGDNIYFISPSSSLDINGLLKPGDLYIAAQGKEIPGDWDWTKTPPKEFTVLSSSRDPYGFPIFYLIRKN